MLSMLCCCCCCCCCINNETVAFAPARLKDPKVEQLVCVCVCVWENKHIFVCTRHGEVCNLCKYLITLIRKASSFIMSRNCQPDVCLYMWDYFDSSEAYLLPIRLNSHHFSIHAILYFTKHNIHFNSLEIWLDTITNSACKLPIN